MNFVTERIKEKSSQGGLGLIAVGLIILFLGSDSIKNYWRDT